MKLYGKDLDDELAKRKTSKNARRDQGLTIRNAAKQKNISPSEFLAYEYGYDICPHEEWEDSVGGMPIPKFIMKRCKKCGKVAGRSIKKVDDSNMQRVYDVCKKLQKH